MADVKIWIVDAAQPVILFPLGVLYPVSGTVLDAAGDPAARVISVWEEDSTLGLTPYPAAETNLFSSDSDGNFSIPVNHYRPVTLICHGESGENDLVYKDIQVT